MTPGGVYAHLPEKMTVNEGAEELPYLTIICSACAPNPLMAHYVLVIPCVEACRGNLRLAGGGVDVGHCRMR